MSFILFCIIYFLTLWFFFAMLPFEYIENNKMVYASSSAGLLLALIMTFNLVVFRDHHNRIKALEQQCACEQIITGDLNEQE